MISSELREQLKEILLDQCQAMISDLAGLTDAESSYQQRQKELSCLFEIIILVERPHISIDELIEFFLKLIPPFYQSGEIKHVRIDYDNKEYTTSNFEKTAWKISVSEKINNKSFSVDVYFSDERMQFEEDFQIIKETNDKIKHIFENILRIKIIEEARKNYLRDLEEDVSIKADKLHKEIDSLQNTLMNQERIQKELTEYKKRAEMGVLIAEIAHEIINPITNIVNSAQILKGELENPIGEGVQTKMYAFVKHIIAEGERVSHIVRDKVGITREKAEQFPLSEIIETIKSSLTNGASDD